MLPWRWSDSMCHSPDKAGHDAGELCHRPPTGILATTDIEAVLALKADCVLYMARDCNYDEISRILESGTNVVTTRGEFHHPGSMDPEHRAQVEAACRRGADLHSQHREQPGLHLGSGSSGADLD